MKGNLRWREDCTKNLWVSPQNENPRDGHGIKANLFGLHSVDNKYLLLEVTAEGVRSTILWISS